MKSMPYLFGCKFRLTLNTSNVTDVQHTKKEDLLLVLDCSR